MIIHNSLCDFNASNMAFPFVLESFKFSKRIQALDENHVHVKGGTIEITLCKATVSDKQQCVLSRMVLICKNTSEVKIDNISANFNVHLCIDDISSWQLEFAKYHVFDSEDNLFSFYCSDFHIEMESNASNGMNCIDESDCDEPGVIVGFFD